MPQRVYNFRHSHARNVIEDAFGILAVRFRILYNAMEMEPEKCVVVVLAICALHNFLISRKSSYASTTDFDCDIDGHFRENELQSIRSFGHLGRSMNSANDVRQQFKNYFISDGEVEWQYHKIKTTRVIK